MHLLHLKATHSVLLQVIEINTQFNDIRTHFKENVVWSRFVILGSFHFFLCLYKLKVELDYKPNVRVVFISYQSWSEVKPILQGSAKSFLRYLSGQISAELFSRISLRNPLTSMRLPAKGSREIGTYAI